MGTFLNPKQTLPLAGNIRDVKMKEVNGGILCLYFIVVQQFRLHKENHLANFAINATCLQ